ncbi:asparagine synthase [bacterium]|nr:asparagine synthase [bacterium]
MTILINSKFKWIEHKEENIDIFFKGFRVKENIPLLIDCISKLSKYKSLLEVKHDFLGRFIKSLSGQFSIIVKTPMGTIMIVDKVSSIPLFYAKYKNQIIISNSAKSITNKYKGNFDNFDKKSFLEMFMSGYTIGRKTLFQGFYKLQAGEYACIDGIHIKINNYYTYSPRNSLESSTNNIKERFEYSILKPMQQLIDDAGDRTIVVPLSAGKDSRLIASSLKYLGAKNIHCFAYGRKNAFESKISREVANKLNIKWTHVPITIRGQKDYFRSIEFKKYVNNVDTLSSIMYLQDVYVVRYLLSNKLISSDSIIVNGNTGDFLSGGHVLPAFKNQSNFNKELIVDIAWNQYLDKHYSLWGALRNKENDRYIIEESKRVMRERGISVSLCGNNLSGFFETLEYLQRQSKYVINMQRAYDFYELEWKMPLWDDLFMDFWEATDLNSKLDQSFYVDALKHFNWGGVWRDVPINNYSNKVSPYWIRPLRNTMKLAFMFFGKDKWYRFEKNKLFYFMDDNSNMAIVPYSKVFMDKRGFRNDFSWIAEEYLATHNLYWKDLKDSGFL